MAWRFYAGQAFGSTSPKVGKVSLVRPIRQMAVLGEIAEPGDRRIEVQFDGTGRTVTLLADDDFGLAVHQGHVELPLLIFRRARAWLLVAEIILLAIHEDDEVGVLFDRAGFTQIR